MYCPECQLTGSEVEMNPAEAAFPPTPDGDVWTTRVWECPKCRHTEYREPDDPEPTND